MDGREAKSEPQPGKRTQIQSSPGTFQNSHILFQADFLCGSVHGWVEGLLTSTIYGEIPLLCYFPQICVSVYVCVCLCIFQSLSPPTAPTHNTGLKCAFYFHPNSLSPLLASQISLPHLKNSQFSFSYTRQGCGTHKASFKVRTVEYIVLV